MEDCKAVFPPAITSLVHLRCVNTITNAGMIPPSPCVCPLLLSLRAHLHARRKKHSGYFMGFYSACTAHVVLSLLIVSVFDACVFMLHCLLVFYLWSHIYCWVLLADVASCDGMLWQHAESCVYTQVA